ncbi:MAG TPA: SAM-dependent methyltransferase [Bacteroidia bacterium]|nr:SAM-dependent methyltransferase [Bacteroidia bacterium]
MAFDDQTRRSLFKTVTACRNLLTGDFDEQLRSRFGIYAAEGRVRDIAALPGLNDIERETARLLRERIGHLAAGKDREAVGEAVRRLLREQAFTVLNRFAALRMAEERDIIRQAVGGGLQSNGFRVFEQIAGAALGTQYERYLVYLDCLFDELSLDLGALFDRSDAMGLLFPSENALRELFAILNAPDIVRLWGEDETIGWVYQYYNDPEERKRMRKESAAPRNSRELAVRNQFFTPRYVVEFLTDNTLGRVWYEMTKGETRLKEKCCYLVRRSHEVFLEEGEKVPEPSDRERFDREDRFRQPAHIPHRPIKDPREIRLLDPACGSMHFGLYAFDLFETIYEEAWDLESTGNGQLETENPHAPLPRLYASKEEFMRDVPRLIIENNVHGIDIDPRAVQIAGLSLWLRGQKAWKILGVKPAERPRIRRSNIACAEPMPGGAELPDDFAASLQSETASDALGGLIQTIFEKMEVAGEAGSLLKIEEEIRSVIDTARQEWWERQEDLLTRKDGSQREFFETAEQQVIDVLRNYAERAEADSSRRRLFADDAARGFAFIDLCRKRYDAVVMNPPFGEWSARFKPLSKGAYPHSYNDILAAFVERGGQFLVPGGRLGAITSRTCFFLSSFTRWRDHVVLGSLHPELLVDLGHGVMDSAMVEAAAYVLSRTREAAA